MTDVTLTSKQMDALLADGQELMNIRAFLPQALQQSFGEYLSHIATEYITSGTLPAYDEVKHKIDEVIAGLPSGTADQNSARSRLERIWDKVERANEALTNEQMYTILKSGLILDEVERLLPPPISDRMIAFQKRVGNVYADIDPVTPTLSEAQAVFGEAYLALGNAPDAKAKLRNLMDSIGLNPSVPERGNGGGRGHVA